MHNYHIQFIWQLNNLLAAASFFMSAFIIMYAASRGFFAKMRSRHLVLLKKRLESVAASKTLTVNDRCRLLIGKIDPLEAADVISNKSLVLPQKLNEELKACFIAEDKIHQIEHIALKSRNKWRRIQALISLGSSEDPSILTALEKSLLEKDEDISYFSMLSLGHMKSVPAAKVLLDFLGKHIYSGHKVISLLEDFPPSIVEDVVNTTHSPDPFVRFWCVKLLSKFRPVQCLGRIAELTQDTSSDVRAAACECLGEIGLPEAKPALAHCLHDGVWFVRMHAVRALSKVSKSECIPLCTPMLKDSDLLVRESARNAIALYAPHAAG
ncbi:MAG TPA: HEAT repeat domain-containing protein [Patescibacteria group bacterium]|nr:HEAT repeat domain-containing protein [Patescibacteria group bacterium]